jgi:hypothetical protein
VNDAAQPDGAREGLPLTAVRRRRGAAPGVELGRRAARFSQSTIVHRREQTGGGWEIRRAPDHPERRRTMMARAQFAQWARTCPPRARGGAAGALFATFGASASVSIGAATLYLQQPLAGLPFIAGGNLGGAGAGTASLPLTVPASTSFVGMRLLTQAFVLDPSAVGGFCATRAVETWIL